MDDVALTELTGDESASHLGLRSLTLALAQATFKNAPYGCACRSLWRRQGSQRQRRRRRLNCQQPGQRRSLATDDGPGEREAAHDQGWSRKVIVMASSIIIV